jgi:hypothetical protein
LQSVHFEFHLTHYNGIQVYSILTLSSCGKWKYSFFRSEE